MGGYLLGIDAGTGSVRALLVDVETGSTITACREWKHTPSPEGVWAYDFNAERNWTLLVETVRETLEKAKASSREILGIAVASMRHSLMLVRDGQTLFAVPNRDARAATESTELASERGPALYQRTGHWPAPIFMLPRLQWLLRNHPELLRGSIVLTIGDWITWRLCGEIATDFSHAGESMLFDIHKREWVKEWLMELGLPESMLPPVLPSGTTLGWLTPSAAADLGLPSGIPVAVGGGDTQCALLALRVIRQNQLAIVAGTTVPIQGVAERPFLDSEGRLWTGLHILPDCWVVESGAGPMGESMAWFAQTIFPHSPCPPARFMAEASQARPGAGGVISSFGGQIFNARAMAFPVGTITLSHFLGEAPRPALCRAILEGMAFAIKANVEQIASLIGEPSRIAMTGGMTRSPFWNRLVANVLGRPVEISEIPDATALGAAICAGVGAGVFKDLKEGVERLSHTAIVHPEEGICETYGSLYSEWCKYLADLVRAHSLAADLILQNIAEPVKVRAFTPASFRPRILVTAQMDERSLAELGQLGDVRYACYRETLQVLTGDDLVEALRGVQIFITEVDIVDLEALKQLPELRVVVSCRGRAVNVDVEACTAMGIPVLYAPGRNADAVADLTVAFMIALLRKLIPADRFLREPGGEAGDMARMGQAFEAFLGRELWGKTVGLIGLGAIGRKVAQRLVPFGVRLLAYDPYIFPEEAALHDAELVPLEKLLAESDIVSLHAPVTDETRGMINREAIYRMKKGAFLINTARAALVDEEALAEALRNGHLAGAAVDVFSVEPPPSNHPLLMLPNVIATPHIGGNTEEVAIHQSRIVVEDLRRLLAGERPHNILNPEVLEGFSWTSPRRQVEKLEAIAARPAPAVSDLQQEQRFRAVQREERMERKPESVGVQAQMERILYRFCEMAAADKALTQFASGKRVTTHYTFSDIGLEFYLGFRDGKVLAGLGTPPEPAEVRMKADAETLDGILSGRISGTKAAMSGKLSFSGDVRLAMSLQRIQKDIIRLYTQAKEETGGIDFPVVQRPLTAAPIPAPVSLVDPREEMVQAINELYQLGLITATGGNLSVRIEGREECWITPSQVYKGSLRPEMMVRIDFQGNVLDGRAFAPSSEWPMHTAIYQARPGVQAVVHAHAPYATILALARLPFLPITAEASFIKEVPVVPFIMPGTRELAEAVVKALGEKNPVCLLQNHGVVVVATSLRRACNILETVERTAQLIWSCYAVGRKPAILPKEALKALRELGEMMA